MTLLSIVEYMPQIYAYWTGVCISWSLVLILDLNYLCVLIHKFHPCVRKSDKHLLVILGLGIFLTALGVLFSIFVSSLLVDVFFSLIFWYTIYLIFATIKIYTGLIKVDPSHISENHKSVFMFL